MQTYLVGGAVRDQLLNLTGYDRDWVVVGATVDEMLAQGYQQVGKDFPVFLHPKSKEEYALARTERKSGTGYKGFVVHAAPDVTLEQDLQRRDLTINAMAQDAEGNLIDPWGGARDLEHRKLRHVSPAFSEDPLRVLRVARFAARFQPFGFSVADDTMQLMRDMAASGELQSLTPERVWREVQLAMAQPGAAVFIEVLRDSHALAQILPEVDALFGIPQPETWHPEIDTGIHTLMSLRQACRLSDDPIVRFAVLVHDVGKGLTPETDWPRHIAHEHRGLALIDELCDRLRVPNDYRALARHCCEYHTHCHRALELKPATVLKLFNALDVFRRPERLEPFLIACESDARGRTGFEARDYPQADYLRTAFQAANAVRVAELLKNSEKRPSGEQIRQKLQEARQLAIAGVSQRNSSEPDK